MEHDQHLRLSHARGRGDRRPGAGLHAGRRDRLRRGRPRPGPGGRRLRPPALVLLRGLVGAVRGGGQVPGRAPDVGPDHEGAVRGPEPQVDDVPVPHPDRGLVADRPVDRQQRRPDHPPGPRGRPRRHPEPPHQLARRGAGPADRRVRPAGPADPADHRPRGGRHRDAGPAGGLLVRGVADRPARGGRDRLPRRDRRHGRHARGHRGRLPAAPDPGVRLPRPARDRARRPDRRRRQHVPRRRARRPAGAPADRPGGGATPGRGAPPGPGGARRRRLGGRHAPARG